MYKRLEVRGYPYNKSVYKECHCVLCIIRSSKEWFQLDYRETAPKAAYADMYADNSSLSSIIGKTKSMFFLPKSNEIFCLSFLSSEKLLERRC